MHVLAIDPGNEESAWVLYDTDARLPIDFGKQPNKDVLGRIYLKPSVGFEVVPDRIVIEMVASYGMAVGREVFDTVLWIGRFYEAWNVMSEGGVEPQLMFRREVKMHLCGNNTAKDSNIRCALIDRYGPGKEKAVGRKATPGPLYGISNDVWSALAIAVTWADRYAATRLNELIA